MIQNIHRQCEMNIQRFLDSMFRFSENYIQINESFFIGMGVSSVDFSILTDLSNSF